MDSEVTEELKSYKLRRNSRRKRDPQKSDPRESDRQEWPPRVNPLAKALAAVPMYSGQLLIWWPVRLHLRIDMLVRVKDYHWLDGEEKEKFTMKTRKAGSTGEEGKRAFYV